MDFTEFNYDLGKNSYDKSNSKLYAFLATNYDISNLAYKITAANKAKINTMSLKSKGSVAI